MTRAEKVNKLKAKIDQLWQIAAQDACGKHVQAVAQLRYDISKLFNELDTRYASKIEETATVHGDLRPSAGESQREMSPEICGARVLS